jgi:hypothetical protein
VTPRARLTDPPTSHRAASSVRNLRESQEAVLRCFLWGPMTDEELVNAYDPDGPLQEHPQSPSGLRTRRKELCDLGLVEDSGERRRLKSGRLAVVWSLSGRESAPVHGSSSVNESRAGVQGRVDHSVPPRPESDTTLFPLPPVSGASTSAITGRKL